MLIQSDGCESLSNNLWGTKLAWIKEETAQTSFTALNIKTIDLSK